jgi:hypothetical protein
MKIKEYESLFDPDYNFNNIPYCGAYDITKADANNKVIIS